MRFGSRRFARSLAARVRVVVKRRGVPVPSAWRNTVAQRRVLSPLIFRLGLPAAGIVVAGMFRDEPVLLAGVAGWWWLLCVLTKAGELLAATQMHPLSGYAAHHPVDPTLLWRSVRQRLVWAWVWVSLEFSIGLALIGGLRAWEGALPIAVAAGTALACLSLAAVVAMQRFVPAAWGGRVALTGFGLGAAGIFGGWLASQMSGVLGRYFLPVVEAGASVSPGGWLTLRYLQDGDAMSQRWLWWCGVLVAAVALLSVLAHGVAARMVAAFRRQDDELYRASESVISADAGDQPTSRSTRDEIVSTWRAAAMPEPWRGRWLFGGLSARALRWGRAIWPTVPSLGGQMSWRVLLLFAPVVLRPVLGRIAPSLTATPDVIAGALLWFSLVPCALTSWKAFMPVAVGLRVAGWHAFFPVDYWGLSRVLLRVELARVVAAWPWMAAYVFLNLRWTGLSLGDQVAAFVASAGLAVAVQPLRIVLAFSKDSRDSSRVTVVFLGLLGLAALILALFLTAALTGAFGAVGTSAGIVVIVAVALLIWAVYGWLYGRLPWDLMRTPPR